MDRNGKGGANIVESIKGRGVSKNDITGYFLLDYVKKMAALHKKS